MSYDYDKFVHPVPAGYTIPKGTQVRHVGQMPFRTEMFFTVLSDFPIDTEDATEYYLDYDITRPKLPTKIFSVIYNVRAHGRKYPVAVRLAVYWAAFNDEGTVTALKDRGIESFDLAPPEEDDDE